MEILFIRNIVDVEAIAAFNICMENFPDWKVSAGKERRRQFLLELANQLVTHPRLTFDVEQSHPHCKRLSRWP